MIPFSSQAKSTLLQGSLQSVSEHGRRVTAWSCLLSTDHSDLSLCCVLSYFSSG